MPMLTREPWFGPKRALGWGWTPVTWQGWAVTALFVLLILGDTVIFRKRWFSLPAVFVLVALLLLIAVLTGTPPGGPGD